MIALTREPSGRRASTIGELSSTRRPTPLTMRSMTRSRCAIVLERRRHALEHAAALDEHVLVGVDQDVADRRVAQQRLERPEAEHVVEQLAEQRFALAEAERRVLFGEQLAEQRADLALGARAIGLRQRLEVQAVEQLAVDAGLAARGTAGAAAPARSGRRPPAAGRGRAMRGCGDCIMVFTRWTRGARGPSGLRFALAPARRHAGLGIENLPREADRTAPRCRCCRSAPAARRS